MFTHFKNDSLRNLVIAFGSLFNNIYVKRYNSDGSEKESMRIPLAYGNKEKYLRRIDEGGSITNEDGVVVQMTLPRMSFEIENIEYDTSRKRNTMQKLAKRNSDSDEKMNTTYAEVPYSVNFNLYIMTKHMADGLQIIEQILPYFTPEFTVTINPTSMHSKMDIPLILNSVDSEEDWEGDYDTRRSLTWTLTFTAKSYIYGRTATSERIKRVLSTIFDSTLSVSGTTGGAGSMIDIGITGPSGASSDVSDYSPTETIRVWGSNTGDIDIYGDIIGE